MSGQPAVEPVQPPLEDPPKDTTTAAGLLNAFTVDVEDYYQVGAFEDLIAREDWDGFEPRVERNTVKLLKILDAHNTKGTFFMLGWVAERWPQLVLEICAAGHELAIHGYDHRRITSQTPQEFRGDVRKAKRIVEDIAGIEVVGYRAPNYSVVRETLWAVDILLEEGFQYDSSIFPILHDRYGIPGAPRFPWHIRQKNGADLKEFPASTVRFFGFNLPFVGGGYLRQFPMWFIRWGLRHLNSAEKQPGVVYIHPWELDPDQPVQPVGALTRIRHYRNLGQTETRLRSLLREFRFGSMREVLDL